MGNEKFSDEIGTPLTQAMMLLEMAMDNHSHQPMLDMVAASHSLVQLAWQRYAGSETIPLPSGTNELLAAISAESAIEIAKGMKGGKA